MSGPVGKEPADEARVRAALEQAAPRPSPGHDAAVLAAAARVAEELRGKAASRRPRWHVPAALAASLLMAGFLAVFATRERGDPDALRGSTGTLQVIPSDGTKLGAAPANLEWAALTGASHYQVTLRDAEGAVLGTGLSETPKIPLASLTTSTLSPGTYFWVVRAGGPAMDLQLGPYSFEIEAN